MRRRHWGLILLCALVPVRAQEQPTKLTPGQEQYRAAVKDLVAARQVLVKQLQAAASADEKQKVQRQIVGLFVKHSERFFKIAADHPKDPGAEDALMHVATLLGIDETTEEQGAKAFALLVADFPESKRLGAALQLAKPAAAAGLEKPLRRLLETHADPEVQSQACVILAENLRRRHEKSLQQDAGKPSPLLDAAVELLKSGQAKFASTKSASEYAGALFALEHLTVGKRPPAIEGEDVASGKPLNLDDVKGKVVVLCFWGNWCPPCRALFPHQRELAKRLEGKPFTFLGVNSDKGRDNAKAAIAKEQLAWPHFWNGGSQAGPISQLYKVRIWPTIYVLDRRGVIRFRNVTGPALDAAVDRLMTDRQSGKES
jgi:thiol-disulfide isomerase/thioredoxin